ncbi:integrase [Aliiruegeria haliotis]|uniref:Integrase n=1 Tax=Aliiruegeria haliotis TaxID=1280846 RepID=A0A2T0RUN1_9RHOB|nr:site-specific integrase [Aliiruegeria haliotis]PRY24848.1 integrase [Aliiruegeria haliotis]
MRVTALNQLSARSIKSLPNGMHSDGGGLYLRAKGNSRSWIFRYTFGGKKKEIGLGSIQSVTLSTARQKAAGNREIIATGGDPKVAKEAAKAAAVAPVEVKAMTFETAMQEFLTGHLKTLTNRKAKTQWENSLRMHAASLLPMTCADITASDIHTCLDPIWMAKMETASRVRQRIEKILAFADAKEDRDRRNPADMDGKLGFLLPKQAKVRVVKHHAAVPVTDAPDAFLRLWVKRDNGMGYAAMVTAILTGLRSGEARNLRWSDIRDDHILIPADRMKARRDHRIPLTPLLEAHLFAQHRFAGTDLVHPGTSGRPISDMTMAQAMRRSGLGNYTPHGWRSTFSDWANGSGYSRDHVEDQLAHTIGNAVERAYRRSDFLDQRRPLMEAWEGFVAAQVNEGGLLHAAE